MSSQNTFPGQGRGRPAVPSARAAQQEQQQRHPSWVNPQAQLHAPAQPAGNAWPPEQQHGYQDSFTPPSNYGGHNPQHGSHGDQQAQDYGRWAELQTGNRNQGHQGGAPLNDPYAPQFEPYTPAEHGNYGGQPSQHHGHQAASQWPPQGGADSRGFDANHYGAPAQTNQGGYGGAAAYGEHAYHENELSASDWAGQPGAFGTDPYQQPGQGGALGFAQAEGGDLDMAYEDEEGEYEDEEAPRRRWPLKIMAALAGAIVIGGGMAYGYKKISTTEFSGEPPIIKSEAFPSKTKPADAGGKMFPYSDTKIMGRLGDGTSSAPADAAPAAEPAHDDAQQQTADASHDAEPAQADEGGPRKVSTLVVGRDGSIQAPPPGTVAGGSGVAVPGTALVDTFGNHGRAQAAEASPPPASKPVTPVTVNSTASARSAQTGSIGAQDDAVAPPAKAKALKKVARAESGTATDAYSDTSSSPVTASGSGTAAHSGFVAVLASIPKSSSSRMDALKRFADMQQKYSSALSGKTPDVLSASLAKGKYDRLVVGPPGSRSEANSVCSELKSAGYNDCWVASY